MAKGHKTGGRVPGTPNRLTREIREVLKDILTGELESLPEILKELDSEKRVDAIIKILPYILPKVEPVNFKDGEPWEPEPW